MSENEQAEAVWRVPDVAAMIAVERCLLFASNPPVATDALVAFPMEH
jgi:hypothetical protein